VNAHLVDENMHGPADSLAAPTAKLGLGVPIQDAAKIIAALKSLLSKLAAPDTQNEGATLEAKGLAMLAQLFATMSPLEDELSAATPQARSTGDPSQQAHLAARKCACF
jgi:hypothetical protein